jgi:magnesium transporter
MPKITRLPIAYIRKSPVSAGRVLATMSPQTSAAFLEQLSASDAASVFASMQPLTAAGTMHAMDSAAGAAILKEMDFSGASAIVRQMERPDRDRLFDELPKRVRAALEKSLSYAPGTVGAHMTTSFATLSTHDDAASALETIRQSNRDELDAVFVVDDQRKFVGYVSTSIALRRPKATSLGELMDTSCPAVSAFSRLESIAEPVVWHDLSRLPVVNRQREVIGVISRAALKSSLQVGAGHQDIDAGPIFSSMIGALASTTSGLLGLVAKTSSSDTSSQESSHER